MQHRMASLHGDRKLYSAACARLQGESPVVSHPVTPHLSPFKIADYYMMRPLTIAACLALTTAMFPAAAQEATVPATTTPPAAAATAAPAVSGNAENGRGLTYTCQGCHGIAGYRNAYPNFHVPKIGGQSSEYLVNALSEYKKGTRKHPTMQAQAQSFSEQDIADIAAFLSNLK
jgi:cytochrome c553